MKILMIFNELFGRSFENRFVFYPFKFLFGGRSKKELFKVVNALISSAYTLRARSYDAPYFQVPVQLSCLLVVARYN